MRFMISTVLLLYVAGCVPISPPVGQVFDGCQSDVECSDGIFCNGIETCSNGSCIAGNDPCPDANCIESRKQCESVTDDSSLSAREICLRANFSNDNIVESLAFMSILKSGGTTESEFIFEILDESGVCLALCISEESLANEFITAEDCVANCKSCFVALAGELW